jgi:hypothetical protein
MKKMDELSEICHSIAENTAGTLLDTIEAQRKEIEQLQMIIDETRGVVGYPPAYGLKMYELKDTLPDAARYWFKYDFDNVLKRDAFIGAQQKEIEQLKQFTPKQGEGIYDAKQIRQIMAQNAVCKELLEEAKEDINTLTNNYNCLDTCEHYPKCKYELPTCEGYVWRGSKAGDSK